MTQKEKDSPTTLGQVLLRERELRGIELEEVSRVTRVRYAYLEGLERGTYADLPADVYVRGYVRAYARFLGIDAEQCIERYVSEAPRRKVGPVTEFNEKGEALSAPAPMPALSGNGPEPASGSQRAAHPAGSPRRLGLVFVILLLIIAALTISIIYYKNRQGESGAGKNQPSTTETATFEVSG